MTYDRVDGLGPLKLPATHTSCEGHVCELFSVFVAWLNCFFMAAQSSKAFENHNIPIMIEFITPEYMKKKLLSVLETWKLSWKSLFFQITESVNWVVTEIQIRE